MSFKKAVIVAGEMTTAYGGRFERCWQGLLSAKHALTPVRHFNASLFPSAEAGLAGDFASGPGHSRVMSMLGPLLEDARGIIPKDSICFLSTTLGEIEYLERSVLGSGEDAEESCPAKLLSKLETRLGLKNRGVVISAACASSNTAIAEAAGRIEDGAIDCALIIACDSVSEFIYAGFSSLLALGRERARPFDQNREGLTVGEAAGWILIMSEERALREKRKILAEIAGWGMNNDANHMTGPSRDGSGLSGSIELSLKQAKIRPDQVAAISAHGTGTLYNDAMEMKAFKKVFEKNIPAFSIKGAVGHTMGAAGLIEALICAKVLEEQKVPPTVGLDQVDEEAEGWVSGECQKVEGDYVLSTNSGFGGINASLLLKRVNS